MDGLDLHFLHVRGQGHPGGPRPYPLLLLHGWPGSIWEFMELIDPLTDPGAHGGDPDDAFDIVVPSLPGFGFSGKPRVPGWNVTRIAAAMNELMVGLGYDGYGAQGGDWGGVISAQLGADFPQHCRAIHVNQTAVRLPKQMPAETAGMGHLVRPRSPSRRPWRQFPKEPYLIPRAISEQRYRVVRWTDMPAGGHFAALEQPITLLKDVREFFRTIR